MCFVCSQAPRTVHPCTVTSSNEDAHPHHLLANRKQPLGGRGRCEASTRAYPSRVLCLHPPTWHSTLTTIDEAHLILTEGITSNAVQMNNGFWKSDVHYAHMEYICTCLFTA